MYILLGKNPYPHFIGQRLLTQIQYSVPKVSSLDLSYVYIISTIMPIESNELIQLAGIMNIEPTLYQFEPNAAEYADFISIPYVFSQSSWALNAKNIIESCGIDSIHLLSTWHQ